MGIVGKVVDQDSSPEKYVDSTGFLSEQLAVNAIHIQKLHRNFSVVFYGVLMICCDYPQLNVCDYLQLNFCGYSHTNFSGYPKNNMWLTMDEFCVYINIILSFCGFLQIIAVIFIAISVEMSDYQPNNDSLKSLRDKRSEIWSSHVYLT